MKQKGLMKKFSALLLATAMTVSTFPQFSISVFAEEANELPTEQYENEEQLKSHETNNPMARMQVFIKAVTSNKHITLELEPTVT